VASLQVFGMPLTAQCQVLAGLSILVVVSLLAKNLVRARLLARSG
jgi:hypothetical protein